MAAFLIVAGLTGSILSFKHELDEWLNPDLMRVEKRDAPRLDIDQLARAAEKAVPNGEATGMALDREGNQAAIISMRGRTDPETGKRLPIEFSGVFLDPYDGTLLGGRNYGAVKFDAPHFIPFIYRLHYTLYLPGAWGLWVMGIIALIWFLDNFIGAYLTFPASRKSAPQTDNKRTNGRNWWQRWKPAWKIKTQAGGYRINYDMHRAFGLWLWLVLGAVALSSVYLNLGNSVFNPVVKLFAEVTPYPVHLKSGNASAEKTDRRISFADAIDRARNHLPEDAQHLVPAFLVHYDRSDAIRVAFNSPSLDNSWFRIRFEEIFVDAHDGGVRGQWGTESGEAGDIFNATMYPIHTGQIFALPGRILICIVGVLITVLSVTGIIIWLKKRTARANPSRHGGNSRHRAHRRHCE